MTFNWTAYNFQLDEKSPVEAMQLFPRFAAARVEDALSDTRVVLLTGPRQAGKTTLARMLATSGMAFHTLDNATTLASARDDPVGFVRGLDRAIIDEIQRAPDLLLAIKESVDADRRPGRFLLTGSANLATLPRVADSLAGRMEVVRLLPLAQCEMRRTESAFIESVFKGAVPRFSNAVTGDSLTSIIVAGSYPEALTRRSHARRQDWYLDYTDAIIQRDVRDVAQVELLRQMPRLLRALAHHSGQLVNYSGFGAALGMNHVTTQKYAAVLEQLFLIRTLPPWYSNELKRLVKTPKVHFLDSGLLAALRDLSVERLKAERRPIGALLETFVFAELIKLAGWTDRRIEFFHFRDKEGNEVDVVMQDRGEKVVGIEVKASASVNADDFKGLKRLAEACGRQFAIGLVLFDHDKVVPFGDRLYAVPISALW